jgi:hypothetical protein
MTLKLDFGYNRGIPTDAKAAWGARLIINQDGMVDIVPDRLGFADDSEPEAKEKLRGHLNGVVGKAPFDQLRTWLIDRTVSTRDDVEHVLFDDGTARVIGSAQSSAGYFYIVAFLI